ncbi:disks large-associated protein 5-like isoform X2 [Acipenser ruthenus]|uniref:disks large-associated protein 5-like isoform X2 n=1 Tax=Acipenser ruthenus TaxID=7906 RepID=UPI002741842D|nr:disks large-associated protein 5-like isoform X2 [Acipenser ruthenus]
MEPPVSRFASRFRKDASVELLRVKMARRRSQSQKENRELAIAKSRGLALQDPNISTVRESELSVLEAEEAFQETRSVLRKPAALAGVSKAVVERKQMLERYKEAKVLQKMKEQREKAKKGVFKVGVFKPDPQFFLPSVLGQPNTRAQHKVKDPPAPVCANRVNTRSMAKKPDPPKKGVVSQPLEAPVRKATVLTRGQKQAAAAAPPASTTHRAVPQPALTRAPVTRASKPSAAPVTVKTRTSHRAATAKGQTKETELKKKPVKDPQVPEESRTVPVPKLKSDAVEMGEHVLKTCRQTSERETPASVPAEQSSAPVESQQPPSFAPDNYVFQPPAWITAHCLTPMSPCSASAFLVPTFRWSPVQRSKSGSCQPTAVTDFRNEVLRPDCKAHEPSNSTAPPEETPDSERLDVAPQSPDNYLHSSKSENLAPSPTAESGNSIPDMFSPRKDDQEMVDCPLKEYQDMQTSSRKEDPAFGSSPRKDDQEMTSSPVKNEQAVLGSARKLGDAPLKVDQEVAGSPRKCDQDMEVSSPIKADYQKMSSPRKDDQEMAGDNSVVFCPHNKDDHTLEETSSKVDQALSCPNKDDQTQAVSPSRESQAGFASSSQQDQSVPAPGGEREARNAASWGTQGQPAEPPHDVPYFRGAIEKETERLTFLSEQWQSRTEEAGIPEEIQDLMRTTVGQARLLMAERFKQFAGLVDDCEFKRGEKETTCTDLEGFWDMVYFQVEDVNKKFTNLTELQESGWQQISHFQPRAKKAVKKAAPPSKAGKAEGPSVTAARSRLAAVKAAMKARKQEAELQRKVAEEEPKQTMPVVVFDAGFFKVESPAKLQPGKRISRCSTAHSCATPLRAVSAEGPDSSRTTGSPLHNVLQTPERPCSPPALNPPCSPDHTQEMNHSAHTRVAAQDVLSRTPNTENEFQVFDFEKYLQPMARLSESPATCLAPWDSVAPLQSLGDAMDMSSPGLQLQDVEMDSPVPPTQLEEPGHTRTVHTPCNDVIKNLETVAPISSPQVAAFLPFTPMIINPARQSLALQDLMMFTPPSS